MYFISILLMVLWALLIVWIAHRALHAHEKFTSILKWPFERPTEFFVFFALAIAVILLMYIGFFYYDNTYRSIASYNKTTLGVFIAYNGDHGRFSYKFLSDGKWYFGYGSPTNQQTSRIIEGEPFTVYFEQNNPNNNSVSEPMSSVKQRFSMIILFGAVLIAVLALIVRKIGALTRSSS